MPSKRKQVNVRVDSETETRLQRLLPVVKESLGLEVTISDLFRLGMIELEKKHSTVSTGLPPKAETKPKPAKRRKGE